MNSPIQLRQFVRRVLAMRTDKRFTEVQLFEGVRRFCVDKLTVEELAEAIEWNQARALIEREFNEDVDADEFFLTPAGKAKEGLAK